METGIANLLGALSLAVMDRIEQGAREVIGRGGETPAALVVIGYGQGMTNDKLRRILGLSHSGTVRLVDRLVSDHLVERRPGKDGREVALYLTAKGAATRNELMESRISAVASLLDVLSPAETKRLGTLIRELLASRTPPRWIASRSAGCATTASVPIARCPQTRASANVSTKLWPSAKRSMTKHSSSAEILTRLEPHRGGLWKAQALPAKAAAQTSKRVQNATCKTGL